MHRRKLIVDLQRLSAEVHRPLDPGRILVRLVLPPVRFAEPCVSERVTIVHRDGAREALDGQIDVLGPVESLQKASSLNILLVGAERGGAAGCDGAPCLGIQLQVE